MLEIWILLLSCV